MLCAARLPLLRHRQPAAAIPHSNPFVHLKIEDHRYPVCTCRCHCPPPTAAACDPLTQTGELLVEIPQPTKEQLNNNRWSIFCEYSEWVPRLIGCLFGVPTALWRARAMLYHECLPVRMVRRNMFCCSPRARQARQIFASAKTECVRFCSAILTVFREMRDVDHDSRAARRHHSSALRKLHPFGYQ